MNPDFIANIVQLVIAVANEVPDIVTVIENAVNATKSGTGPTNDDITAAVAKAQANNAAIQAG